MYEIKNWKKFQHYGDRESVPWIKLHIDLLQSELWITLDDASRLLAIVCMLHASKNKGQVVWGIDTLKEYGRIKSKVSFKPLIDCGFLVPIANASNTLANANDSLSYSLSDSESEKGGVGGKTKQPDYSESFLEFWNHYPKQRIGSKPDAWKSWKKTLAGGEIDESGLIAVCLVYAASEEVAKGYAKGCAAWLNDERWRSNYSPISKKEQSQPAKKSDYFSTIIQSTARAAKILEA